jgi:hypothetical protein
LDDSSVTQACTINVRLSNLNWSVYKQNKKKTNYLRNYKHTVVN